MSNAASQFQSDQAKFLVTRGSGAHIAARDLATAIGRGLFIEEWRDFRWAHIARIEPKDGEQVDIVYMETADSKDTTQDGNVRNDITISKVVEKVLTVDADDLILVSTEEIARPKSRRHGQIITYVNEEIAD